MCVIFLLSGLLHPGHEIYIFKHHMTEILVVLDVPFELYHLQVGPVVYISGLDYLLLIVNDRANKHRLPC
jgi:hypothetical protein